MPTANRTISQVLEEFLSDQEARLSQRTVSKYDDIVSLFKNYLESYWLDVRREPDHLDESNPFTPPLRRVAEIARHLGRTP